MGDHEDIDHTGLTGTGIPATTVDAKGDLIAGTAADTVARLAAGANDTILMADSGQSTGLKWVASQTPTDQDYDDVAAQGTADTYARGDHLHGMPAAGGGGAGTQLDYVQKTTASSITAVAGVGADTVVTGASQAYAAVPIEITFSAPNFNADDEAIGDLLYIRLFEDGAELCAIAATGTPAAQFMYNPCFGRYQMTPTAATHQYSIRANLSSGGAGNTGTITAGAGTGGAYAPMFMKIVTV